jgi:hypothetical protein
MKWSYWGYEEVELKIPRDGVGVGGAFCLYFCLKNGMSLKYLA